MAHLSKLHTRRRSNCVLRNPLGSCVVSWSKRFDESIVLEDGTTLRTLQQVIQYLAKTVPKSEQKHEKVLNAGRSPDPIG
jgi:hypothetical protein